MATRKNSAERGAWNSWRGMLSRCYSPTSNNFHDYGARGIRVCERWRLFANFYADMGERPEGKMLDRIDNSGNYEPGNCRWATRSEQNRNRRSCVWITINGETKLLRDWARQSGLRHGVIRRRMKKGVTGAALIEKRPLGRPRKVVAKVDDEHVEWRGELVRV